MTKTLYLMRHGETLFNQLGLIRDWRGSPLTTNDRQQTQTARDYLYAHHIVFDELYCSAVERCSGTLEIVGERADYTRFKDLKEFNFGRMEGKPKCLHPNREPNRKGHDDLYLEYDGESEAQVKKWISNIVFRPVSQADDNVMILAAGHANAIMNLFSALELDNHPKLHFLNCCISNYSIADSAYDLIEITDPASGQIYNK